MAVGAIASLLAGCVDAQSVDSEAMAVAEDGANLEPTTSIRQGFEDTQLGGIPSGWTVSGYGGRTLAVSDELAARGNQALRIDVAAGQGPVVAMLLRGNLGELSEAHYGRIFMRIQGPGPSQFVHFDAFEGTGSWEGETNAVRWASTGTGVGTAPSNWSWIYNVQTRDRGEFGTERERSAHAKVDDWMCLEWRLDAATQEARFWSDSAAVEYLSLQASSGDRTEIPPFNSLAVGFQKFQQTDGFVVWIDEVAFERERIGCE